MTSFMRRAGLAALAAGVAVVSLAPAAAAAPVDTSRPLEERLADYRASRGVSVDLSTPMEERLAEYRGASVIDRGDEARTLADALGSVDLAPGDKYVALGDSYTAMGSPLGTLGMVSDPVGMSCVRADDGLGPRVAGLLDLELVDASCSGAVPAHYWKAQNANPPQREAVTEDVKLVTMTMGGNLMIPASMSNPIACGASIFASTEECRATLRSTGVVDQLVDIWDDLKGRAPQAELVAVGYLVHDFDQGLVPAYNELVAEAADIAGVRYVDPGRGMDLTGGFQGGWGIHPSQVGQAGAADHIAMSLGYAPINGSTPANEEARPLIDPLPTQRTMVK